MGSLQKLQEVKYDGIETISIVSVSGNFEIVLDQEIDTKGVGISYEKSKNPTGLSVLQVGKLLEIKEVLETGSYGNGKYIIRVSSNISIDFKSESGSLDIGKVGGSFNFSSSSGSLTANEISIDSTSSFISMSGSVRITVAEFKSGDLEVHSLSNTVYLTIKREESLSRNVEMKSRKDKGRIVYPKSMRIEEREELIHDQVIAVKTYHAINAKGLIDVQTRSGKVILKLKE